MHTSFVYGNLQDCHNGKIRNEYFPPPFESIGLCFKIPLHRVPSIANTLAPPHVNLTLKLLWQASLNSQTCSYSMALAPNVNHNMLRKLYTVTCHPLEW